MSDMIVCGDGSMFCISDHSSIGSTIFCEMLKHQAAVSLHSKYQTNQEVRVTSNERAIINSLIPTYNFYDAKMIAKSLVGETVEIISPDRLSNNGVVGTYYTIRRLYDPGFYVLPEELLEEIE